MIAWFQSLPLIPGAILVVGGFVLFSLLFARLASRFAPVSVLAEHNELTGFIFAVVGVMYAVILGFITIGVWARFQAAEDRTFSEASSLAAVYRDAGAFANGSRIRQDARAYVDTVIRVGWPLLERGGANPPTFTGAERLAREVRATRPRGEREDAIYASMLGDMDQALRDRDARVAEDSNGLNGVMWTVVFIGGFVTIAFTFFFGFRYTALQNAMVGTLAFLTGLVIFLTMSLDYPLRGSVHVGPEAFLHADYLFKRIDAVDPLPASQTP
ncbi:MAG TPA: hypothetical protein VMA98_05720 [Candidatus Acidoferrales bacterium]|nr:hypothetical protein [Candidatus Acidoferrales bacterium]